MALRNSRILSGQSYAVFVALPCGIRFRSYGGSVENFCLRGVCLVEDAGAGEWDSQVELRFGDMRAEVWKRVKLPPQ
jgi:hypothetical protein